MSSERFQTLYPVLELDTDARNGIFLTPIPTIFCCWTLEWVSYARLNIIISYTFYHSWKTGLEFLSCIFLICSANDSTCSNHRWGLDSNWLPLKRYNIPRDVFISVSADGGSGMVGRGMFSGQNKLCRRHDPQASGVYRPRIPHPLDPLPTWLFYCLSFKCQRNTFFPGNCGFSENYK